jgi:hypothetical protein
VHEIRRAIERVDDPQVIVAGPQAAFLGEKTVAGVALANRLDDDVLRHLVDLGHEFVARLVPHLDFMDPAQIAGGGVAGFAHGAYRSVQ